MEKEIKKVLKKEKIEFPLNDRENIDFMAYTLERDIKDFPFGLYLRGSASGDDWWLQCEYYSKKLQHTIIWSYDFTDSYESEEDLIEVLTCTARDIKAFEKRLSIKK